MHKPKPQLRLLAGRRNNTPPSKCSKIPEIYASKNWTIFTAKTLQFLADKVLLLNSLGLWEAVTRLVLSNGENLHRGTSLRAGIATSLVYNGFLQIEWTESFGDEGRNKKYRSVKEIFLDMFLRPTYTEYDEEECAEQHSGGPDLSGFNAQKDRS